VFSSINFFFLIVVGSSYWNLGIRRLTGEIKEDLEGIKTFKVLGQDFANVLK